MATTPPTNVDPTDLIIISVEDFTEAKVAGKGVYDTLMQANAAHLEKEFNASRIKGNEYAQIYLGTMQATMETALQFFIQKYKLGYEAKLLEIQARIAEVELEKTRAELEIARLNAQKVPAEIELIQAQTSVAQEQVELVKNQAANELLQGKVLVAQECKLRADFDLLMATIPKVNAETQLLLQKDITEKAQTNGSIGDSESVIGRQRLLYKAQTDGFTRDAEQKVAKLMIDTWNVRRTTDEGTEANTVNKLSDSYIGSSVLKLLQGVGAPAA